jgi:predicted metal-binding membrane protein
MNAMPGMANAAPTSLISMTAATMIAMMIGMMLPSALPQIARRGALFGSGYLVVWGLAGAVAAVVQFGLDRAGLLSETMALRSIPVAALVVAGVGLYQLTPLKRACLARCRVLGAETAGMLSGVRYGVSCVGCCWGLMALLFVAGMMNVVALVAISAFIVTEKMLPRGVAIAKLAGIALVACAIVIPLAR